MRLVSFQACLLVLPVMFAISTLGHASTADTKAFDLSTEASKSFRSWLVTIVEDQVSRGPNPRWNHQDCAGLVRFAVREAIVTHDEAWRKANGFLGRALPAEVEMSKDQRAELKQWRTSDGSKSNFVRALPLIQKNTVFVGKSIDRIEPGDLLFFDQGDEQHVMVWTGRRIVYHNGRRPKPGEKSADNGLRAVTLRELSQWADTRWQPRIENPNFVGFYRLSFLNNAQNFAQGSL